ncbi:MAG: transcriptional regulator [Pseudomonadota bacterium]|nr:transcriptional regulator [Pseudomonadota bacterium]
MAEFTQADMDWLSGPHVTRAWFGEFDLPTGIRYLHNGVGEVEVEGQTYVGVTDPVGGLLVGISAVEDPRFGQAAKVDIILSGVNVEFFKSVKRDARAIEGRTATLRFGAFDPETGQIKLFKNMFPGKMSAPTLHRQGVGTRYVGLTVESFWEAQNFPFGGKWNDADQRRRYPGDKGLQFVGVKVAEKWE